MGCDYLNGKRALNPKDKSEEGNQNKDREQYRHDLDENINSL
jgi:hypothetical protein